MQIHLEHLTLETRLLGDPTALPVIVLIQGLGTPMTRWPELLLELLHDAGFAVVIFDNRDIGLSTALDALGRPDLTRLRNANPFVLPFSPALPPYTLADMAEDVIGLMDALHIREAHIVGASMGGMIAQIIAACHPARCLSLTSIMSSSGNPLLPPPAPAALQALFAPLPFPQTEEAIVADSVKRQKILMSPRYPTPDDELSAMFTAEFRRAFRPLGVARQLAALMTGGDRRRMLTDVRAPTVVLHGTDDPLILPACGRDTAYAIPAAELRLVPGMAHDFPVALVPVFAEAILGAARRAF
ncbi:MAG: alpha/beta fold hydrolase [Zoogloeaceae bacterium]|jgi:pimeloyl-ACP methyl ester carboxylesterase|nr:alpha/beta fold hydrolase [Zoogloeaceae bacterium]